MLRITIDLVPFGDESRVRRIGSAYIANISSSIGEVSDYRFRFEQGPWQGRVYGPYVGRIQNWPRKYRCAWSLVQEALRRGLKRSPSTRLAKAQLDQRLSVPPLTHVLRSIDRDGLCAAMSRSDMLTAEQISEMADVAIATVSGWRKSGRLIGIGQGGSFVIRRAS